MHDCIESWFWSWASTFYLDTWTLKARKAAHLGIHPRKVALQRVQLLGDRVRRCVDGASQLHLAGRSPLISVSFFTSPYKKGHSISWCFLQLPALGNPMSKHPTVGASGFAIELGACLVVGAFGSMKLPQAASYWNIACANHVCGIHNISCRRI